MKRVFYIIGGIIILLLVGILLFLLFASKDQKTAIFNKFNINNSTSSDGILNTVVDTLTGDGGSGDLAALRQLTTKQVIGEVEVDQTASSTNPAVYFAEAGTGHVYVVDTVTGTENRISNITIPKARKAVFSRDHNYAAIASEGGRDGDAITVEYLPRDGVELSSFTINELARDFSMTTDGFVLYTTLVADVLTARSFDIKKKETKTLFSLPFKEATVRFGRKSDDTIYVYPKTAEKLEGYLYMVVGGKLSRLPVAGYGLNAIASGPYTLYSAKINGTYQSAIYDASNGNVTPLTTTFIAEKCSFTNEDSTVFCGSDGSTNPTRPELWYKGVYSPNDSLWEITTPSNTALPVQELITPKDSAGRDFDIIGISSSRDASRLYFINKTDSSLWIFDRSKSPVQ
jgi:hypothetical protein